MGFWCIFFPFTRRVGGLFCPAGKRSANLAQSQYRRDLFSPSEDTPPVQQEPAGTCSSGFRFFLAFQMTRVDPLTKDNTELHLTQTKQLRQKVTQIHFLNIKACKLAIWTL